MKYFVPLLAFALTMAPAAAGAIWAGMTERQLIDSSALIVTGTLTEKTRITLANGAVLHLGVIRVAESHKGDAGPGAVLIALPAPRRIAVSTDIRYRIGQRGLWLLRPHGGAVGGIYLADHPQRFMPLERAAAILKRLQDEKQGR